MLPGAVGSVLAYTGDGQLITRTDAGLQTWDLISCQPVETWPQITQIPQLLVTDAKGTRLAVGDGMSHTVDVWDITKRPIRRSVRLPNDGPPHWAAFDPEGKHLATSAWGGQVLLWDLQDQHSVTVGPASGGAIAFSPDGKTLAVADGMNNTIDLIDLPSKKVRKTLPGFSNVSTTFAVATMSFSPDGKTLVVAGATNQASMWDVQGNRAAIYLTGHVGDLTSLAFGPDGKTLATGSQDGTAKLWDSERGAVLRTLYPQGMGGVESVAFDPTGNLVVGTSSTVTVWSASGLHTEASPSGSPEPGGSGSSTAYTFLGGYLVIAPVVALVAAVVWFVRFRRSRDMIDSRGVWRRPSVLWTVTLPVALTLVTNLATDTVHMSWRWWPATVWILVVGLVAASAFAERTRTRSVNLRSHPRVPGDRAVVAEHAGNVTSGGGNIIGDGTTINVVTVQNVEDRHE